MKFQVEPFDYGAGIAISGTAGCLRQGFTVRRRRGQLEAARTVLLVGLAKHSLRLWLRHSAPNPRAALTRSKYGRLDRKRRSPRS